MCRKKSSFDGSSLSRSLSSQQAHDATVCIREPGTPPRGGYTQKNERRADRSAKYDTSLSGKRYRVKAAAAAAAAAVAAVAEAVALLLHPHDFVGFWRGAWLRDFSVRCRGKANKLLASPASTQRHRLCTKRRAFHKRDAHLCAN